MNGKEPLGREATDIGPPVAKGDIQRKNKDGNDNKLRHGNTSKIYQRLFFLFFFRFF